MESINLDMEDLFDNDARVDDDEDMMMGEQSHDPEGMEETNEGGATQTQPEGEDVLAQLRDLSKGAAKKRVMKPQPKLDPVRLTGERGIPILPKLFEKVHFKGKGHEGEDLKLMMGKLEHWAHRLFPKMTFDEVIERAERLGGKKGVQTCVKRIRLDMPILNEDFVSRQEDNEEETNKDNQNGDQEVDVDAEEVLDDLLQQESQPAPRADQLDDDEWEAMMQEEAAQSQAPSTPAVDTDDHVTPQKPSTSKSTANQSLTEEQKERMERNRRLAMEKRMAARSKSHTANSQEKTPHQEASTSKDDGSTEDHIQNTSDQEPNMEEENETQGVKSSPQNTESENSQSLLENGGTDTKCAMSQQNDSQQSHSEQSKPENIAD